VALKKFRKKNPGRPLWKSFRASKDPSLFIVLAEDSAALLGLLFAFLGVLLSQLTGNHVFDGIASMLIGALLATVALVLGRETGGLLVGESASDELVRKIERVVREDPLVEQMGRVLTMQLGPSEVLVNLAVAFRGGLSNADISATAQRLEKHIREVHPSITRVFIDLGPVAQQRPHEPAPAT
jgi:divalent metal cation (Fe/Co/Zn/Cd) transporter